MALIPTLSNADQGAEVIFYNTSIEISNSKKIILNEIQIQINDESGSDYTEIALSYKSDDKLKIKEALILDMEGNIIKSLKKSDIQESSARSSSAFYVDQQLLKFDLHWNKYPFQIKYVYEREIKEFYIISNWYPYIDDDIVHHKYQLKLTVPNDYKVKMKAHGNFEYSVLPGSEQVIYTWNSKESFKFKEEKYAPDFIEIVPHVNILPVEFTYDERGSQQTWKDFGDWIYSLNKNLDELTFTDSYQVKLLTDTIDDQIKKVRALYHYLQDNTRYINIPLGTGGMKPYPASYVCENKYGDCKALSIYMQALLKSAGIKSYTVDIIAGRSHERLDTEFPGQFFNHVILCVPLGGDTIWLENTSQITPFNYLGTFTQGRTALLIDSGQSKLVNTPALENHDVLTSSTLRIKLNSDKNAVIDFNYNVRGRSFEYYNYVITNEAEDDKKENLLDLLNMDKAEIQSISMDKKNRDSRTISINATINQNEAFKIYANKAVIYPETIGLPTMEKPEDRGQNLIIHYPIFKVDTFIYDLTELDFQNKKYPENVVIESEFGKYSIDTKQTENGLFHVKTFLLNKGEYPLEKYPEFYGWIKESKDFDEDFKIILTKD